MGDEFGEVDSRPEEDAGADYWDEPLADGRPVRSRIVAAVVLVAFVTWFFAGTLAILFPEPAREMQRLGERSAFEAGAWREQPDRRFGMAEDLERTGRLNGLSRDELEALLGPADTRPSEDDRAPSLVVEYRLGSTVVPWPRDDVLLVSLVPEGRKVAGTRIGVPARFTRRDWRLFPGYRVEMGRDLVERRAFTGLDRARVVELLGPLERSAGPADGTSLSYGLGGAQVLSLGFGTDGRVAEQGVYTSQ
jgi:hypothetical protein